jgi:hypothetical protein
MQQDVPHTPISALCYLDASKVDSPAGVLAGLDLLSADGDRLGSVQGVVIEPAERRVRYYDVRLASQFKSRRFLVEADQLAHLDPARKVLRLRPNAAIEPVQDLDVAALRSFSDDDLIAAVFAARAA